MLRRRFRFQGSGGIRFVYQQGKTVRGRSIALRYAVNTRRTDSRCAVVIAKKVLKQAPKRNRVRRRVYEIVRTQWSRIQPGYDLLWTLHDPSIFRMTHSELSEMILSLLSQSGIQNS